MEKFDDLNELRETTRRNARIATEADASKPTELRLSTDRRALNDLLEILIPGDNYFNAPIAEPCDRFVVGSKPEDLTNVCDLMSASLGNSAIDRGTFSSMTHFIERAGIYAAP
jgi:hypothetical protein